MSQGAWLSGKILSLRFLFVGGEGGFVSSEAGLADDGLISWRVLL